LRFDAEQTSIDRIHPARHLFNDHPDQHQGIGVDVANDRRREFGLRIVQAVAGSKRLQGHLEVFVTRNHAIDRGGH